MPGTLKFGAFFAPFHKPGQDPAHALEYDLQRVEALDDYGFDEAWFGEHHSGGYELIGNPEIFIAAAAQRTKRIKLGTGVVSLPYHHPFLLADRLVMLDNLTRGRLIIGTGPGALPGDAYQMGIDPLEQRRMHDEGMEALMALLTSKEPVTRETDWFTLREAQLQLPPYQQPHPEVAVAAMISPSGPTLAGKYGVSLLSLSLSAGGPDGYAAIGNAWSVVEEQAEKFSQPKPDRSTWRVVGQVHIAETREQAREDCAYGLKDYLDYFQFGAGVVPLTGGEQASEERRKAVDHYADRGAAVIGTPDDLIEYLENLLETSGGFGTFLMLGHDWARPDRTLESYRLISKHVIPHFQGRLEAARTAHDWSTAHRADTFDRAQQAVVKAIKDHAVANPEGAGARK